MTCNYHRRVKRGSRMPPRKVKSQVPINATKKQTSISAEDDEEYKEKRDRNNIAVKKSREKTRDKMKETVVVVKHLKEENVELEKKCDVLAKELAVLKDLFTAHAQSSSGSTTAQISSGNKGTKRKSREVEDGPSEVKLVNVSAITKDHEYSSTPAKRKHSTLQDV